MSTLPPPPPIRSPVVFLFESVASDLLETPGTLRGKSRGGVGPGPVTPLGGRTQGDHLAKEQTGDYHRGRRGALQVEPYLQAAGPFFFRSRRLL